MASVQRRPDGRWRARYRDLSGRERARHFPRKIDAERFLTTVRADLLRGVYVDPDDQTTVTAYARQWAATRPHGERTARRVDSVIRNHIEATSLGGRRLASVRPSEVQAWASDRAQVLAPATVRKVVSVLRAVYAAAVLDRLVGSSPVVNLALPRAERERVVPLTVAQVRALANAIGRWDRDGRPEDFRTRYRAMVLTQAGLGLRVGELLGLRVQDVNFLGRSVRIEHQADPDTGALVPPKTPRSRRTLPLPQVVADELAGHLAAYPASAGGLLFHSASGRTLGHDFYASRVFARAVVRAGLPAGTSTHDLRHAYASWLLAAGESVVAVAERLGHESATLVLTTYGHLVPGSEERTRKAVDDVFATAVDEPRADSARTFRS